MGNKKIQRCGYRHKRNFFFKEKFLTDFLDSDNYRSF